MSYELKLYLIGLAVTIAFFIPYVISVYKHVKSGKSKT